MREFTLSAYSDFLQNCIKTHSCLPVREYTQESLKPVLYLRHDVDRKPEKALQLAKLEHELHVQSTYFFRCTAECFVPDLIQEIECLGHEIGYHYENLSTAAQKLKINRKDMKSISQHFAIELHRTMRQSAIASEQLHDDSIFAELLNQLDSSLQIATTELLDLAMQDFTLNLERFRKLTPITSIAMHGMPFLPIDNRILWLKECYRDYNVEIEPYFDIDYNKVLYITDAGRSWYDPKANQRDKVATDMSFVFHSLLEIQQAIQARKLPSKILMNIHPEHWTDSSIEWLKIAAIRYVKTQVKRLI